MESVQIRVIYSCTKKGLKEHYTISVRIIPLLHISIGTAFGSVEQNFPF